MATDKRDHNDRQDTAQQDTAQQDAAERNAVEQPAPPQRIGVMGGTFDPIHHGHLVAASEVCHRLQLDLVVFVPTGDPWQKRDTLRTAAEDRYAMTVAATANHPQFRVSRVDIERSGATYTVDTLQDLAREYTDESAVAPELFFITGADSLASLATWHRWEEIFSLATVVGVTRPGYGLAESDLAALEEYLQQVVLVEIPAIDISSTQCRWRSAHGEPLWYLMPDAVARFIESRRLYRML